MQPGHDMPLGAAGLGGKVAQAVADLKLIGVLRMVFGAEAPGQTEPGDGEQGPDGVCPVSVVINGSADGQERICRVRVNHALWNRIL
jgi:hypothetical protein